MSVSVSDSVSVQQAGGRDACMSGICMSEDGLMPRREDYNIVSNPVVAIRSVVLLFGSN